MLLDLSEDKKSAIDWANAHFAPEQIRPLSKADLKWSSKRDALAQVRALKPYSFAIFTPDLRLHSGLSALMLFGILAGARQVVIGDARGATVTHSRSGVLLGQVPRLVVEVVCGYCVIIPVSWLFTELLGISLAFRRTVRASRTNRPVSDTDNRQGLNVLYVRATPARAAEGGMPTHIAGFASGAAALGHRLMFLISGGTTGDDVISIAPSSAITATRTLSAIWDNLAFTARTLRLIRNDERLSNEIDFIYQRYSRFNWTGVALSVFTGLPLALEFNGSEVWVSRHWDPIGQLSLLKRFERLNQKAADVIFVVSDVERRNLIRSGVSRSKIIVNPNGVDPARFHPGCGGSEVRRALGIDDRTVIGFIGTFGPWHGAPVLAQAALAVRKESGCHFLFIGDGDQRSQTESLIGASVDATFTGRISHDKVPAYLDACDVLVSPHVASPDGTDFFGSPTKLFEYMAMGKAIVASRLGQIADIIADDRNGLLVEPGDADDLAQAIEKLASDQALRKRLGEAARQTAIERYTWTHNAARVFDAARARFAVNRTAPK